LKILLEVKTMLQTYECPKQGAIQFIDKKCHLDKICQPKDLQIVSEVKDRDQAIYDICVDIRLSQGMNEIGIMKGARYE